MQNINLPDLKWGIYCRKSSDSEDKQIASLPSQERELKELADRSGIKNIVRIFKESHSAFHPGRPDFNEMMAMVYSGEINAILVWAGNRIARNSVDSGTCIYSMDQGKLLAVKTIGGTYFNTPDHKFSLSIDFTVSKKSSDDLSAAVHRGNRDKFFERKEWAGPAKQGFINYIDPLTRKRDIQIDEDRFNLLQQAGKQIVNGKFTPLEALDWLNNDMGYRTLTQRKQGGGPLAETTFYNFLSDSFYYGVMRHKVDAIFQEGDHKYKKMFTKDEWDFLQIRLGKKSRSKQKKHDFPFKGVMSCGECGGFITAEKKIQIICPECKTKFTKTSNRTECIGCHLRIDLMNDPKILNYTYYRCTRKVNKNCTQKSLEINELEKQVDQELQKFEIDPDFKDWAIKHLGELNDNEMKQDDRATQRNVGNYESLKSGLRRMTKHRFTDAYEKSSSEEKEIYEEELESLKNQIKSVKDNIETVDQKQYDWIDLSRKTFEFACYARYWFHNGDVKTKTQILEMLGSNLKLYNKKVLVNEDNLWWIIEKAKKEVETLGITVEPTKKAGPIDFNAYLDPAIPTVLRD